MNDINNNEIYSRETFRHIGQYVCIANTYYVYMKDINNHDLFSALYQICRINFFENYSKKFKL